MVIMDIICCLLQYVAFTKLRKIYCDVLKPNLTFKRTKNIIEKEKAEISLKLPKTRLRVVFEYAAYCNQDILSLTPYPLSHASLTIDKH